MCGFFGMTFRKFGGMKLRLRGLSQHPTPKINRDCLCLATARTWYDRAALPPGRKRVVEGYLITLLFPPGA